jgi:hypothetical protein
VVYLDLTRDDHAYFFGFFQTDGYLGRGPGRKGKAQIEIASRDAATLVAFAPLFPGLRSSIRYRTRNTNFADNYESATWSAGSLEFREELASLGIPVGRKSSTVAPPAVDFDARGYLRGLIDGDGSVGFTSAGRPFVSFVSASRELAQFFCTQVEAVTGARRTPGPNQRDNIYAPMVMSDPAARLASWLYPLGCLSLERKAEAGRAVAAWQRPAGMRARPTHGKRIWTAEDDAVVLASTIRDAALQLNRSENAVNMRRWRLRRGQ